MKDLKRKSAAIAIAALMLTACGKKTNSKDFKAESETESNKDEAVAVTPTSDSSGTDSESSVAEEDNVIDEGYEIIQAAISDFKEDGRSVEGFRANVSISGTYAPILESAEEGTEITDSGVDSSSVSSSSSVTETSSASEDSSSTSDSMNDSSSESEKQTVYGEPEEIEAYYTIDVMQEGAHLKGIQFVDDDVRKLEAYYLPSNVETTIYYSCNDTGIWHKYSSFNEFVIPDYLDVMRDNAKANFVNAEIISEPDGQSNDYVVSTKITDDRMKYVTAAIFESIFFTEYYNMPELSGTTIFDCGFDYQTEEYWLKNVEVNLKNEQLDVKISADCYNYGTIYDVAVPTEALSAGLFDYQANGEHFWVNNEEDVKNVEEPDEEDTDDSSTADDSSSLADDSSSSGDDSSEETASSADSSSNEDSSKDDSSSKADKKDKKEDK